MSQTDEGYVRAAVERYVRAMSTADEQGLRAVFHPSASIIGNYQGAVEWLSVDAYLSEVLGAGLPPNHAPIWEIAAIDVDHDIASVKLDDAFGSMTFTNYLSLLKVGDDWKIVSKVYHIHA